eukprot:g1270.t1
MAHAHVHERQGWNQQCARHCVNNMLQLCEADGGVSKRELDRIAARLFVREAELAGSSAPFLNPNKSVLGLGNYSVGVLEMAFAARGFDCTERVRTSDVDAQASSAGAACAEGRLVGFVVNRPSPSLLGLLKTRHWYAVRRLRCGESRGDDGGRGAGEGDGGARGGDGGAGGWRWHALDSLAAAPQYLGGCAALAARLRAELEGGGNVLLVQRSAGGSAAQWVQQMAEHRASKASQVKLSQKRLASPPAMLAAAEALARDAGVPAELSLSAAEMWCSLTEATGRPPRVVHVDYM